MRKQKPISAINVMKKLRVKKEETGKKLALIKSDADNIKRLLEINGMVFSSEAETLFSKMNQIIDAFISANQNFDNNKLKTIYDELYSARDWVDQITNEKERSFFEKRFLQIIELAEQIVPFANNDQQAKKTADKITGGVKSAVNEGKIESVNKVPDIVSSIQADQNTSIVQPKVTPATPVSTTPPVINSESSSKNESTNDDIKASLERQSQLQEDFNEKILALLSDIRDNTGGKQYSSNTNREKYNPTKERLRAKAKGGLQDFAESTNNKTMSLVLKAMGALGGLASGIFSAAGSIVKMIPASVAAAGVGGAVGAAWFGSRSGEILGKDEKNVTSAEKMGVTGAGAAMGAFAAGTPAGRILTATLGVADLAMKTIYGEKAKDLNITKELTDSVASGIGKTVGDISKYGAGEGIKDILYGNFKEDRDKESKARVDEGVKQAVANVEKKKATEALNTFNEYNKLTEEQKAIITGRFPSNSTTTSNPTPEAIEAVGGRASYDANIAGTNTPKIGPLITAERVQTPKLIETPKTAEPVLSDNKSSIDQFTQFYANQMGIKTNTASFNEVGIASSHGESKGDPGIVSGLTYGMIKAYEMLPNAEKNNNGEIKDVNAFKSVAKNSGIKLDPGGPSYGLYQFTTWSNFKPNESYPLGMFLKHLKNNPEAKEISNILEVEGGGFRNAASLDKDKNAQFRQAWKKAAADPKFGKLQVDFYTHGDKKIGFTSPYQEVLGQFKKAGIDASDSLVLKNTAWAGGVLGTANSQSIINNLQNKYNTKNLSSVLSNDQFVKEYYSGAASLSMNKSNVQGSTAKRYMEDADKQSELYRQEVSFRTNGSELNQKAIVADRSKSSPVQQPTAAPPVIISQNTSNQTTGNVAMGVSPRTGSSHRSLTANQRASRT